MEYASFLRHWMYPPAARTVSVWRWLARVLAIALFHILSALLVAQLATIPGDISAIWIPDAIALAGALIWGSQIWLGIFIGTFFGGLLYYYISPSSPFVIAVHASLAIGDVFTALVSMSLIRYFTRTCYPFSQASHVLVFIMFGVCLNQVLDAGIGTTLLGASQIIAWTDVKVVFLTWWLSGSAGIIIVTPTLLTWYNAIYRPWLKHRRRIVLWSFWQEAVIWSGLVITVSFLAFWQRFQIEYLLLVLLIWSVFRFAKPLTMLAVTLIGLVAVIGTAKGRSIFFQADINQALLLLNSFVATISVTTLFLMAILDERAQLMTYLQKSKEELETRVMERTQALSMMNERLSRLSTTDTLTGCLNRLKLEEYLKYHFSLYDRYKQVFSVILLDLDYFKRVNDNYGHLAGDELLIEVVSLIQNRLRKTDIFGRWGGEEFIILCPNTSSERAIVLAEMLRQTLASHYFQSVGQQTASFGVTECGTCHRSLNDLLRYADEALYAAKAKGRNCTEVHLCGTVA